MNRIRRYTWSAMALFSLTAAVTLLNQWLYLMFGDWLIAMVLASCVAMAWLNKMPHRRDRRLS